MHPDSLYLLWTHDWGPAGTMSSWSSNLVPQILEEVFGRREGGNEKDGRTEIVKRRNTKCWCPHVALFFHFP